MKKKGFVKIIGKLLCFIFLLSGNSYAGSGSIDIGPLPKIQNSSHQFRRAVLDIRNRVGLDANDCIENARGMDSVGSYVARFAKTVETDKLAILEVSATMMCDGVHTSTYQYGISLDKKTGKRFDLSTVYDIAIHHDGKIFLRPELVPEAKASYRTKNSRNYSCLNVSDIQQTLKNSPLTFSQTEVDPLQFTMMWQISIRSVFRR
ncbi:hypothetical protein [Paraburkholderia sp. J7]|uniref:hypothetical protein n=1 Tax=Paraburkholderia sp. J7 TaxID=2805438 RepID=UPI002AB6E6BB|nr:hypothetical protein [Paraburkholderia sp. J7]